MRATGAQVTYLRRLMNEAHAKRVRTGLIINDWPRVTKAEASLMIDDIKRKLEVAAAEVTR
jgi:hypothetical protein